MLRPLRNTRQVMSLHEACGIPSVRYAWGRRVPGMTSEYNGARLDSAATAILSVGLWRTAPGHYVSGDKVLRLRGFKSVPDDNIRSALRAALGKLDDSMNALLQLNPAKAVTK